MSDSQDGNQGGKERGSTLVSAYINSTEHYLFSLAWPSICPPHLQIRHVQPVNEIYGQEIR